MKRSLYARFLLWVVARSRRRQIEAWRHDHVDLPHTFAARIARSQLHRKRKPLRVILLERGWWPAERWPA